MEPDWGLGPTPDLSLRVSVATLVRVVFSHPISGERMLALEQKATLLEGAQEAAIDVRSQPFGGAIRILDLNALQARIGDFHFDSARARSEQDLRVFIHPASWPVLRAFCIQRLSQAADPVLEIDPARELVEEFHDALEFDLQPHHYTCVPVGTVVENEPTPTANIHARGIFTVRIYRVFETHISDPVLARSMVENSQRSDDRALRRLAWADFQNGGKGRANAVLALPLKPLRAWYAAMTPGERNLPVVYQQHRLNETVAAVFDDLRVPKYQRLSR